MELPITVRFVDDCLDDNKRMNDDELLFSVRLQVILDTSNAVITSSTTIAIHCHFLFNNSRTKQSLE